VGATAATGAGGVRVSSAVAATGGFRLSGLALICSPLSSPGAPSRRGCRRPGPAVCASSRYFRKSVANDARSRTRAAPFLDVIVEDVAHGCADHDVAVIVEVGE